VADRFSLLKYGLAVVLVFVGAKMMAIDLVKIPVGLSLAIVATVIGTSVLLSLRLDARRRAAATRAPAKA
jgi:tellurite resistance protein TerC